MSGLYYNITHEEMYDFLSQLGFTQIDLFGTSEVIYAKLIDKNISLRVYTSIVNGSARKSGRDAIRLVLMRRYANGQIVPISGKSNRVNRTINWRDNLQKRMNTILTTYTQQKDAHYAASR